MSLYRTILKRAWENTWRHKYLWFFGLFAALLGNGGELELIFRGLDEPGKSGIIYGFASIAETGIFSAAALDNMARMFREDPVSLFVALSVLFFVLIIVIFLFWLTVISQVAIVLNTSKEKHDKEHDFKDGLYTGIKKFWPVFGLNLLGRLIIAVLFLFLSLPLLLNFFQNHAFGRNFSFILLFIVLIPISLALSFIIKFAIASVVIKGERILPALKFGWNLFRENWLVSIEMAILLFFINCLAGIALILSFLVLAVPFMFFAMMFTQIAASANFWLLAMAGTAVLIIMIAFAGAILSTFQISAWTHLFMELVGKGGVAKISRIFSKEK